VSGSPDRPRSALYRGALVHARRDEHARRAFRYPVYVASIDLDELPALDRELRLFSHRRWNLFSLDDRDYATGGAARLRDGHARLLAEHGLPAPASARLGTNLKVLGYVFNPVSFFLGYDAAGAGRGEGFNGGDPFAFERTDGGDAGADRHAVLVDGASAANAHATTELRTGEAQEVAQVPKQRKLRIAVELVLDAVNYDRRHDGNLLIASARGTCTW
jgi:hypothetical protein